MKIVILDSDSIFGKSLISLLANSSYKIIHLSLKKDINLLNLAATKEVFRKLMPDVIYNFASWGGGVHFLAEYFADVFHTNMLMALNLYKAVSQVCPGVRIVNTLANCSYPGEALIQREQEWFGGQVHESVLPYGSVKRMQYVLAYCYQKQFRVRSLNFIIPNHYGPGDYTDPARVHAINGMIIRMIEAKRQGKKEFEIWGSGKPVREWGYIEDIAKVLKLALNLSRDFIYPVNIGQKKGYSIAESAKLIAGAVGFGGKLVFNKKYQDGAPVKVLDNKNFKKIFGNFRFTDHASGIARTVRYYESVL